MIGTQEIKYQWRGEMLGEKQPKWKLASDQRAGYICIYLSVLLKHIFDKICYWLSAFVSKVMFCEALHNLYTQKLCNKNNTFFKYQYNEQ